MNTTEHHRVPVRTVSRRAFLRTASTATVTAGVSSGTLAACGGSGAGGNQLVVWGFPGVIEGIKAILPTFKRHFRSLDVKVRVFDYNSVHTNLLNAINGGTGAPDLASIDCSYLAAYTQGLVDLSDKRSQVATQFVNPTIRLSSYRGKFYGLVTDSEPIAIAYRKDIWDRYGVNEDDIETWDDFGKAGDHISESSGGKTYMYPLLRNETSTYETMAVEQGFGGFYFNEDDSKVIVDDPKIVEAVGVLKRLWDSKGIFRNPDGGYAGDEATSLLKKGTVAATLCPAWYPSTLKENMPEESGKWRLMRLPAVRRGGPRVGYQYPTIFVIPQQSSQADDAWRLEKMGLTGTGARELFTRHHVLPAWTPLLNELHSKVDPYFGGQDVYTLWNEIAADNPRITFGTGFQQAQNIMGKYLSEVLAGKTTPAAGMKAAAGDMRNKLQKG